MFIPAEVVANQATDNAEGRVIEVNSISTVFGRRNNANLPKNELVCKEIKNEQKTSI